MRAGPTQRGVSASGGAPFVPSPVHHHRGPPRLHHRDRTVIGRRPITCAGDVSLHCSLCRVSQRSPFSMPPLSGRSGALAPADLCGRALG
jgi:hypothetical protein